MAERVSPTRGILVVTDASFLVAKLTELERSGTLIRGPKLASVFPSRWATGAFEFWLQPNFN